MQADSVALSTAVHGTALQVQGCARYVDFQALGCSREGEGVSRLAHTAPAEAFLLPSLLS